MLLEGAAGRQEGAFADLTKLRAATAGTRVDAACASRSSGARLRRGAAVRSIAGGVNVYNLDGGCISGASQRLSWPLSAVLPLLEKCRSS